MNLSLLIIIIYLLLVLGLGFWANLLLKKTGEDYFVASRTIGPFLLLMSLFGTNMTTFAILGSSGEAYHEGIGVFGLMASISALVMPCIFFFVGTRVWALGKRFGYLTQVQYFRERWGSDRLGLLLFAVLIATVRTDERAPYRVLRFQNSAATMTGNRPANPAKDQMARLKMLLSVKNDSKSVITTIKETKARPSLT